MADQPELPEEELEVDYSNLPVLPLRDVVVYPYMVIPLFVGREKSIKALEAAMLQNKRIVLVAQRKASEDDPVPENLFTFGTIASLLQLLKLPDGTVKVLVEGEQRVKIDNYSTDEGYISSAVQEVVEVSEKLKDKEVQIMVRSLMSQFEQYLSLIHI